MKKSLKRMLILFLSAILIASSAACKPSDKPEDPNKPDNPITPDDPNKPDIELNVTDKLLALNGASDYEIVIPANASADIRETAQFLQSIIHSATNATLPVKNEKGGLNESEKVISLGDTQILSEAQTAGKIEKDLTAEKLNRDGYVIRLLGNTVVIAAAHDAGVYYGALEFLNRQFKYQMYADDEIYYETTNQSYLFDYDLTDIPTFAGRDIDGYTLYYPAYCKQMRLTRVGGYNEVKQIPNDCHTIEKFFNENKDIGVDPFSYEKNEKGEETYYFYEKYPNDTNGYKLCLTNPKAVKYTIRGAKKLLMENPDADYVNIAEMDFQGYCSGREGVCTCKTDMETYKISGVWIRFVNQVIKAVEEWKKDPVKDYEQKTAAGDDGAVAITAEQAEAVKKGHWNYTTFAYGHGTFIAPTKIDENGNTVAIDDSVIPDEKLYMKLAPLDIMCVNHAFNAEECTKNTQNVYQQFKNWKVLTDHYTTWSYMTNFKDYFNYVPYASIVQKNAQVYRDMGVHTYFSQSINGTRYCSNYALFYYLYAKTAWNCDLNGKKTIDDFMAHYYRDGAEAMTKYINHMDTWCAIAAEKKNLHPGNYSSLSTDWYDKNVLEKAMEYIDEAFGAIEKYKTSDAELYKKLRKRLAIDRLSIRYLQLSGYDKYYSIATVSTQGMQFLAEFKSDMEAVGTSFYMNEQLKTVEQCYNEFEKKLKGMI